MPEISPLSRGFDALILAGGEGKRLKAPVPKVLMDLLGRPVIGHVLDAVRALGPSRIVVVGGRSLPLLRAALKGEDGIRFARQPKPLGTAHAVKCGLKALDGSRSADVLILNGDGPLIRPDSLRGTLEAHRAGRADVTVVSARVPDPAGLGRIVRDGEGRFLRIVEERDASPEERDIREINAGQYAVRSAALKRLIPRIGRGNAQGEYYLTDLVGLAGRRALAVSLADPEEARGINSYGEFLEAMEILKLRIAEDHTRRGVTILDPFLTHIEAGVCIEPGAVVHPFSVIRRGVSIRARATVGPYAHLRPGTVLAEGSRVGNFVEVKASTLGADAKALHLSYLGDAEVGPRANIGAGTITANFDGRRKHRTRIGADARIGSGTVLVAPVEVGDGAVTGAGAVVTAGRDVPPGSTAVGVPARVVGDGGEKAPGRSQRPGRRSSGARSRKPKEK